MREHLIHGADGTCRDDGIDSSNGVADSAAEACGVDVGAEDDASRKPTFKNGGGPIGGLRRRDEGRGRRRLIKVRLYVANHADDFAGSLAKQNVLAHRVTARKVSTDKRLI